ncbi:TonB-dependent receptor [Sulfurovum sp. zt1-1]|uniref:TonB-dependent receptor n=1 Tax=Sulfurovum zhangzhouensis TaxID=3019067 RepID=A0ABT7R0X5_9BACT|nr:TonB-dependent receptor [Sulfurovum zhangzhouensis]MDM5272151.1 TonB-dependent receptor [Sulfurovum zhangzhouensis]
MNTKLLPLSLIAALALQSVYAESTTELDPIVVSSDFRAKKLSQTSNAVTVITEDKIYDKSSQAFMEVVGSAANVNFSAGGSKSKYIQIRGMGERGQFETPINPTVGLMIDGVDFSNATLGASLFDVKQIEILRGPQGTLFGANSLAGMVTVESNEPTEETQGHLEATVGNYNTQAFGAAVGGTLIENTLLGRLSIYKNDSDGFIHNSYLNRDDTNGIDELTAKAKLRWFVSDKHTIDMTFMHINNDNGYDAFNRNNTRTTESDEPGRDTQKTNAFALKSVYQVNDQFHVESTVSHSKSDIEYSYDEDWTYTDEYYTSFDQYLRDKKQTDVDVRLVSDEAGKIFNSTTAWTFGAYYKKYESDLVRNNTYFIAPFLSNYSADSRAIYGQLDTDLSPTLKLVTGLRLEQWETDYQDSDGTTFNDTENLVGGKIGLEYQMNASQLYYVTLSRGYKPGGFNPVTDASGLPKQYQTEALWNIDLGVNGSYLDGQLSNRVNLFYGKRKDQQVGTSYVTESYKYTDYITNAEKGTYYGLETELTYRPNDVISFDASLGLLKAKFDTFYNLVDDVSKDGRTPAQSPRYQYNIGLNYFMTENWKFNTNVEGRGSYYFSNSHDEKSDAYALVNASIEYTTGSWSAILWGRNLADADYQTRGYYFDNFGTGEALYTQQGDPRTFGLTVSYDF